MSVRSTASLIQGGKASDYIQPIVEDLLKEAGPLEEMYLALVLKLVSESEEVKLVAEKEEAPDELVVLAHEKASLALSMALKALADLMRLKQEEELIQHKIEDLMARAQANKAKVREVDARIEAHKARAKAFEENLKLAKERLEISKKVSEINRKVNEAKLKKLQLEIAELEKKADPRELIKKAILNEPV